MYPSLVGMEVGGNSFLLGIKGKEQKRFHAPGEGYEDALPPGPDSPEAWWVHNQPCFPPLSAFLSLLVPPIGRTFCKLKVFFSNHEQSTE